MASTRPMAASLAGKTCLLTAAGAGIGRACALAFARSGAQVLATDIDADALAQLAADEPTIATYRLDITDAEAIHAFADDHPDIDVLMNIAGFVHHGTILDCDRADWDRSMHLNVTSMYETCRVVLPGMLDRGHGAIVNMSSVASSVIGAPNRFAYGATKAAVIGLTKAISADFVGQGIRANAICPGTIDTPSLHQRMADTGDAAAARTQFIARQPGGRLGTAEEVAALALFLASDAASFINGTIQIVDGGWSNL